MNKAIVLSSYLFDVTDYFYGFRIEPVEDYERDSYGNAPTKVIFKWGKDINLAHTWNTEKEVHEYMERLGCLDWFEGAFKDHAKLETIIVKPSVHTLSPIDERIGIVEERFAQKNIRKMMRVLVKAAQEDLEKEAKWLSHDTVNEKEHEIIFQDMMDANIYAEGMYVLIEAEASED